MRTSGRMTNRGIRTKQEMQELCGHKNIQTQQQSLQREDGSGQDVDRVDHGRVVKKRFEVKPKGRRRRMRSYILICLQDVEDLQKINIIPLTPNDPYRGRTAPLTSKRCILYNHSTNIRTEYFKRGIFSLFFSLQNAVFFHNSNLFGSFVIHILYTRCAKIKKISSVPKG